MRLTKQKGKRERREKKSPLLRRATSIELYSDYDWLYCKSNYTERAWWYARLIITAGAVILQLSRERLINCDVTQK